MINIPVSTGELIDKITILEIKRSNISNPDQLKNIEHELTLLECVRNENTAQSDKLIQLTAALKDVNMRLWDVEDDIREHESRGDFGPSFIKLARSVYILNDERAKHKREISLLQGSDILEEKSYHPV